jgi:hypothetical protein
MEGPTQAGKMHGMNNGDEIYAIALLNEPTFRMLQSSLKRVYRIDNTDRFDSLLRQLDALDEKRGN